MTTKTSREPALIDTRQLHSIYALIVPIMLFLLILFVGLSSAGCARSAAQPADPPPPKVTVAAVLARDVTEWDEFTGRLEAVNTVAIRPRVSGFVSARALPRGGDRRQRATCCSRSTPRPFQAEVDRLQGRADAGQGDGPARRLGIAARRPPRPRRTRCRSEESDRRASFAAEAVGAGRRGRRRAARRRAQSRVHPRHRADCRPRRPRDRDRGQPRLERSRRGDADDDGGLARSDLRRRSTSTSRRFLRYGNARHAPASAPAPGRPALPIQMALGGGHGSSRAKAS